MKITALVLIAAASSVLAGDIFDEKNPEILLAISRENSEKIAAAKNPTKRAEFARLSLDAAERAKQLAPRNAKVRLNLAIVYGRLAQEESPRRRIEMSTLVKEETEASLARPERSACLAHSGPLELRNGQSQSPSQDPRTSRLWAIPRRLKRSRH